jgi:hypothetical protein
MNPWDILVKEMRIVQGWIEKDKHPIEKKRSGMTQHGTRDEELQRYPEWNVKIQKLDEKARREWLEAWKRSCAGVVDFVLARCVTASSEQGKTSRNGSVSWRNKTL